MFVLLDHALVVLLLIPLVLFERLDFLFVILFALPKLLIIFLRGQRVLLVVFLLIFADPPF